MYKHIEGMSGLVPSYIKMRPGTRLEVKWEWFKSEVLAACDHVRRQQVPARAAA